MLTIDLLQRARRVVFVRLSEYEFLTVVALREGMEVTWWIVGIGRPVRSHKIEHNAQRLGLFDGYAWNLERLIEWVRWHCPVCWNVLQSQRQTYDQNKCRQKAYRQRRKVMPKGVYAKYKVTNAVTGEEIVNTFVLKPESDLHARVALLAYAESVDFENPLLATDLRKWVVDLSQQQPIRPSEGIKVSDLPDWLIEMDRNRKMISGSESNSGE